MVFIEVLIQQPGREVDEMLLLFASSVILPVFVADVANATGAQIRIRNQPPSVEEGGAVCPSGVEPTVDEQKDLFASVLDFVASRVGKGNLFEFWFETVHRAYLVYLYPAVFQQLGSLPPGDSDMGFPPFCPHPLQQVIIDKLDVWKDNATICEMFFSDKFYPFTLEVFNQSCRLPITYLATVKRSLDVFKYFLLLKRRSNIVRDHLVQSFWRAFIQSMALVFTIDSTPAQSDGHAQLFNEVFSTIDFFTLQLATTLEEPTWKTLQYTLLDGTASFLAKNSMSMLSDSKTDLVRMADPLIGYLFAVWIRSPVTTPDMWRDMHVAFAQTTDWPHAVRQWKIKVLSLTEILIKFFHVRRTEYMMPTDLALEDSVNLFLGVPYWTKDSISKMWYTVLNVTGNINHIKSAYNFEVAMKCVQEVVSLLNQAEATIPLREEPRRMPPIDVFMPWLMEACYATGEKIRGVIISYAVLCQLFCTQHVKQIAPELLSHFFRAIQVGLRSENPLVRDQIMSEAKFVFSYDLPGAAVLIPDMLTEITNVFKVRQGATADVQKNALSVFNSLLCFPHHFKGVMVPDVSKSREITSSELREAISSLHIAILNNPNIAPAAKVMNVWGTSLMIFEEVHNESPRINVLAACIQSVITFSRNSNELIAQAAGEALQAMSAAFPMINAVDKNLAYSTLSLMCDSLLAMFQEAAQTGAFKESIMILVFEALNMCVNHGANDFLRDKNLATKFFTVIELGCLGQSVDPVKPSMTLSRVKTEEDLTTAPFYYLIEQLDQKATHNLAGLKAVAEMLLHAVLNWYNAFPTPIGAAQLDANVIEDVDRPLWAFTQNNEKLFTFQDVIVDNAGTSAIRVITRDAAGKHVWLFRHNLLSDQRFPVRNPFTQPPPPVVDLGGGSGGRSASQASSKSKSPLLEMLQQFNSNNPDILPQSSKFVSFDSPVLPDDSYVGELDGAKRLIDKVQKIDSDLLARYKENRPKLDKDFHTLAEPLSGLAQARWLLSHFGFLGPHSRRVFHSLDDNAELRMAIRTLDRHRSREHVDIGVLYIASGQESIQEYVQNRATSIAFSHFVDGLAWKVDPRVHAGYRGDIGHDESPILPYYADVRTEMVYHVSSVLLGQNVPIADVLDADAVQVVWSEHKRDFIMPPKNLLPNQGKDAATDAYLVVYPLSNGLFRLQVQKRDSLVPFGPLMSGMVVTKRLLPSLMRMTSLLAHRRSIKMRYPTWQHPMLERAQALKDMATVAKKLRPPEVFFSHLFPAELDASLTDRPGVQLEATRTRTSSLIAKTAQAPGISLPSGTQAPTTPRVKSTAALQPSENYAAARYSYDTTPQMASKIMSHPAPEHGGAKPELDSFSYASPSDSPGGGLKSSGSSPALKTSLGSSSDHVGASPITFSVGGEPPVSPRGGVATPLAAAGVAKAPAVNRATTSPSISFTANPQAQGRPVGASSVSGPRPAVTSPAGAGAPPGIQSTGPKFPVVARTNSVANGTLTSSGGIGAPPPSNPTPAAAGSSSVVAATSTASPSGSAPPGISKQPMMVGGRPLPIGAVATPGMVAPPKTGATVPGTPPSTRPPGQNITSPRGPVGGPVPTMAPTTSPAPTAVSPSGNPSLQRTSSAGLGRPAPPGQGYPNPVVPAGGPAKSLPPTPAPAPAGSGLPPQPTPKVAVKVPFGVKMPGTQGPAAGMTKAPPPKQPGVFPPTPM